MAKYDYDFKRKCIDAYKNKKMLPTIPGKDEEYVRRLCRDWSLIERKMGDKGLEVKLISKTYTIKEKKKAVRMIKSGISMREVGRIMGMANHGTVRRWYLDYLKDGVAGLQYRKGIKPMTSVKSSNKMSKRLSKGEREELLSLRKRNDVLEIENEYLKKLDALVSKREKEEAKAKKQK